MNTGSRPFSQACENNKGPILEVLERHLQCPGRLLEIGSGTGQHAAWLPRFLPRIEWQPSDLPVNLPGIRLWLEDAPPNVLPPLRLDVNVPDQWPSGRFEYVFSANTLHIMSPVSGGHFLRRAAALLGEGGLLLIYGPFKYGGCFTSDSNQAFDGWLRSRDPAAGIRDHEWVAATLAETGLAEEADHVMPANNRLLVFRRT